MVRGEDEEVREGVAYRSVLLVGRIVELAVNAIIAFELGDNLLHFADQHHGVECGHEVPKLKVFAVDVFQGIFAHLGSHDFWVIGGNVGLLVGKEFLIELFTWAETHFFDFDIFGTIELYHLLCQVVYLDGFAHVEDKDVATFAHRAGFKHEVARLGDGHEVAYDVFVGDGEWATGGQLLLEEWNNTSI